MYLINSYNINNLDINVDDKIEVYLNIIIFMVF